VVLTIYNNQMEPFNERKFVNFLLFVVCYESPV
jgi:hypothetical protein